MTSRNVGSTLPLLGMAPSYQPPLAASVARRVAPRCLLRGCHSRGGAWAPGAPGIADAASLSAPADRELWRWSRGPQRICVARDGPAEGVRTLALGIAADKPVTAIHRLPVQRSVKQAVHAPQLPALAIVTPPAVSRCRGSTGSLPMPRTVFSLPRAPLGAAPRLRRGDGSPALEEKGAPGVPCRHRPRPQRSVDDPHRSPVPPWPPRRPRGVDRWRARRRCQRASLPAADRRHPRAHHEMQHETAYAQLLTYREDNRQHAIFNGLSREQARPAEGDGRPGAEAPRGSADAAPSPARAISCATPPACATRSWKPREACAASLPCGSVPANARRRWSMAIGCGGNGAWPRKARGVVHAHACGRGRGGAP